MLFARRACLVGEAAKEASVEGSSCDSTGKIDAAATSVTRKMVLSWICMVLGQRLIFVRRPDTLILVLTAMGTLFLAKANLVPPSPFQLPRPSIELSTRK